MIGWEALGGGIRPLASNRDERLDADESHFPARFAALLSFAMPLPYCTSVGAALRPCSRTHALWNSVVSGGCEERAALYIDFRSRQENSCAAEHEGALRAVIEAQGWEITATFTDEKPGDRMGRGQMMDALGDGTEFGIVVAASVITLSDSMTDFLAVANNIRIHGARLVLVEDDLDTMQGSGQHLLAALPLLKAIGETFRGQAALKGVERARGKGHSLGRPMQDIALKQEAAKLLADGIGVREVGRRLLMAPSVVSRIKLANSQN